MKSLDLKLHTEDEIEVAGIYIPGSLPFGVVLLHMMPSTKESYQKFSEQLALEGFHTLAIDFRGHGESSGGNWEEFPDEEHQKYIRELHAAVDYLKKQNPEMKIGIVGASIGGNIGVQYGTEHPLSFLVLLSAGINYRGVNAGEMVGNLPESLPVYFASAMDDQRVSGNSTQTETLYNACSSKMKSIQIFKEGGHGTDILENNQEFAQSLVQWIKETATKDAGV
ncbi:MAG TPA: alpha/beta fold hydrolase [Candidatus Binatia bacterium]|nr:alpha/beta fold hydrolase [Candidatus Binatia bacterium]